MNRPLRMPPVLLESDKPAPTRPRRRFWVWLPWILTGMVLASIIVAVAISREPMRELTPALLAQAQERWSAAGIRDYDVLLELRSTGWEAAQNIRAVVRGGKVRELFNHEKPFAAQPDLYTVEGLFDMLKQELDMVRLGAAVPSAKTYLRVRFNQQLGYPERFLRLISGTNQSTELRVRELRRMKAGVTVSPFFRAHLLTYGIALVAQGRVESC